MDNRTDLIEAVFQRMQQVGFVATKAEFSIKLLDKSPSYLTSMKARDRHIGDDVIEVLLDNIQWAMAEEAGEMDAMKSEIARRELMFDHLQELLDYVRVQTQPKTATSEAIDIANNEKSLLKWLTRW